MTALTGKRSPFVPLDDVQAASTISINNSSSGPNQPPVLTPIGSKSVALGSTLTFVVSASDPNTDPLTYSASNLPAGANFNPATKTFSWTPSPSQLGIYPNLHFQVSDGTLSDSEDIAIDVVPTYSDWDVNSDGAVNMLDLATIGQHWGETGAAGWIRQDVNKDGVINTLDNIAIGQHWTP